MGRACLDYFDILLYEEDVDLLRGPEWLNDQVISFYFEYLAREKFKSTNFGFVGGCLASFLVNAGFEDALSNIQPLKLKKKDMILLPVNNSRDPTTPNSGSHWSLLVVSMADKQFLHFDSGEGANKLPARLLSEKMQRLLELGRHSRVTTAECARQTNCYDCGMYCLGAADIICREKEKGTSWSGVSTCLQEELTPEKVTQLRIDLLGLIETKAG